MENDDLTEVSRFKKLAKDHWQVFVLFMIGVIGVIIGGVFVFYWILQNSWIGGYGTWDFGMFSIANFLTLFILVLLLELLLVGAPFCGYGGIIFYLWWARLLSEDEKGWMNPKDKKPKQDISKGVSGIFGFFVFLMFLLLVFLGGNWDTPIGNLPYIYWINTWLLALVLIITIAGVPAIIAGIWYLIRKVE